MELCPQQANNDSVDSIKSVHTTTPFNSVSCIWFQNNPYSIPDAYAADLFSLLQALWWLSGHSGLDQVIRARFQICAPLCVVSRVGVGLQHLIKEALIEVPTLWGKP